MMIMMMMMMRRRRRRRRRRMSHHYDDVIMGAIASQITSLTIVYSTVYSDADQRKHQSSASLAFVWGIHRGPVNSPHKWPVTRKMFPYDEVIMHSCVMDRTNYFFYFRRRYHRMRVFTYQGIPGPKPGFLFGTDMYDEVLKVWQLSWIICMMCPLEVPYTHHAWFTSLMKSCDYLVPSGIILNDISRIEITPFRWIVCIKVTFTFICNSGIFILIKLRPSAEAVLI